MRFKQLNKRVIRREPMVRYSGGGGTSSKEKNGKREVNFLGEEVWRNGGRSFLHEVWI